MKTTKTIIFSSLVIATIFLAGCSNKKDKNFNPINETPQMEEPIANQSNDIEPTQNPHNVKEINNELSTRDKTNDTNNSKKYYKNERLGIKFKFRDLCKSFDCKIIEKENAITSKMSGSSIFVLQKPEDENIKDSILKLVKQEGKNISDCQIVKVDYYGSKNQAFRVVFKTPISAFNFTKEEIKRIELADKNPEGPITGDWVRKEIYNEYAVKSCSDYADPLNIGTSSCYGNVFLYNELKSKTKFIFLSPGCGDPVFYEEATIEILE